MENGYSEISTFIVIKFMLLGSVQIDFFSAKYGYILIQVCC